MNADNIPQELTQREQWITWKIVTRDGEDKPTKLPVNPKTGEMASSTDESTWGSFQQARAHASQSDEIEGVGFVFSEDDLYVGIDLDDCRDPDTGTIEQFGGIIETLDSYTEVSPSGTGVHVIAKGFLPDGGNRKNDVEMYDQSRFFTVTGWQIPGTAEDINERASQIQQIHTEYIREDTTGDSSSPTTDTPDSVDVELDDDEIIEKAREAENGHKFEQLWRGDISSYGNDHSRADQALCNMLAFWTGGDAARIESLFGQSGLTRDKWNNRQDYRNRTIQNAIDNCTEFYNPNQHDSNGDESNVETEDVTTEDGGSEIKDCGYSYTDYTNSENKFRAKLLGEDICTEYSFVTLRDSNQILVYHDGWWQPGGEKVIKEEANRRLGEEFRKGRVTNVVAWVEQRHYTKRQEFQPPERKINVRNGVYDLESGELIEHSPEYNFTFKIDYDYDPEGECPNIDQFLSEVTETEDEKEKLYEIIAYSLLPSNPFNKAAMFAGSGSNGKTVLLDMMKDFIGRENIVNKSLQDLQGDFDAHHLYGKLGMLDDDLPPTRLQSTDMFKKLTGGTDIGAEIKFGDHYDFTPIAFPIFAANQIPPTPDQSHGFFRRWVIVDFPYRFTSNPNPNDPYQKEAKPKRELLNKLTTREEMEGLLAKCIEKLHTLFDNNGFTHELSADEVQSKWREHSTPVTSFFERFVEQGRTRSDDESDKQRKDNPDWSQWSFDYVRKDDLQRMIAAYAKRRGAAKPTMKEITTSLQDSGLNAGPTRTRREPNDLTAEKSNKIRVYSGIKIVFDEEETPEYLLDLFTDGSNQSIVVEGEDEEKSLKEQVDDFMQKHCDEDSMMYNVLLEKLEEQEIVDDAEDAEERVLAIINEGCNEGDYFEPVNGEVQAL